MIVQGNELQLNDLIASYAQRYQCVLVYFDLTRYNALDDAKKATVNAFYQDFIDDYVLDIMKQGIFNTIRFEDETIATLNAGSWFPAPNYCPDEDHYIHAYVVDAYGDIIWENVSRPLTADE